MVPQDLLRHNCLNFLPQSYRSVWPLRPGPGEGGRGQVPTRYEAVGNISSNSDNFLRVLACQGLGIARLAVFHIGQDLRDGLLGTVLSDFMPEHQEPVLAVYLSRRNLSSRVKVFLRFLEERLADSMDWSAPPAKPTDEGEPVSRTRNSMQ